MASVAAAIDRAAHVNVDASLYWNSHSELFEYIEKYGQEPREDAGQDLSEEAEHRQESRAKQFASKLEAHHEWLLNTFTMFKGPSESSKSALNDRALKLGSRMVTIKEEIKAAALQVSTHLDLDQVQSYILVARFVRVDRGGVALPPVDRAFLEKVSLFYYVERQCLLKCLRSLLTFQEARDSDVSRYISIMRPEVQKLVAEKVEDKIVQILKKHVTSSRPKHVTDFEGFDVLVEILCDIFRREEELCSAFWASDSELDGPIRSFMFSIHKQFPCVIVPLLELLRSQCEGAWAAECVYDFLHRLTPMASMYELPSGAFDEQDATSVRTPKDLTVPGAPGLLIPAGTSGQILRSMDNFVVLVQWQCEHSSILVLLLRMAEIVKQGPGLQSDDSGIRELRAFLSLLDKMLEANHVLAQLLLDLDHSAVVEVTQSLGRVQDRLSGNISVVKMICLVVHELVLHFPDVEMIAACLRILSSFVPCYPDMVLQEISKTSLLQPAMDVDGLPSSGEWALANSQIHNLLLSSEQTRGLYPLTLAALQFMQALVDRGLYSGAAGGLVLYMETEILVKHATWRYLRRVERWQISAKVLQVLQSVIGAELTSEEGTQLKRMVTESLLHDTLVLNALFQVLAVDTHGLQELQYNRTVGRAEIEAVEEAICALLNLLSQVVENVNAIASISKKDLPPMSPLEVAIFNRSLGSEPMVSVIASFLQYSHCMSLPEAAAKLLSNLCPAAWRARPHPVTLASYLSSSGQALQLQRALASLLEEETALTLPTLFSAVIHLLVSATEWQPTLVELLLFPPEVPSSANASGTGRPTSDSDMAATSGSTSPSAFENGLDALWAIVRSSDRLLKSNPRVLSEVLFLLASMWQSGSVLYRLIDAVRAKTTFWQSISSCLFSQSSEEVLLRAMSKGPAPLSSNINKDWAAVIGSSTMELDSHHVSNATLKKQELLFLAYHLQCEASVLQLVSFDIFLHQHMVDANATSKEKETGKLLLLEDGQGGGLASSKEAGMTAALQGLQVILEWSKHSSLSPASVMRRYTLSLYDKETQRRAQEEARALVVGIMAQWMTGYERGLHMELSRRIADISRKISELPLMKELVGQYSSRMYSKRGMTAEALVMSDVYHHLCGELEGGREVPPGAFRELSDLLKDSYSLLKNVSSAKGPSSRRHPLYGDRFCYDVEVISSWLGYEWWIEVPQQVVSGTVVEGTLRSMRRANAVLSASNAQLLALNAWEAVMAVAMFDCRGEIRCSSGPDADSWKLKDIADSIHELCKALEHSSRAIGSAAVCHGYLHSITAAQARLLVVFLRLWCPMARRTEQGPSESLALAIVQPNDSRVKSYRGKGPMPTEERGSIDAAGVALCAQVVKTAVLGLKVHAASQGSFRREEKESVIPLLSAFLLVLEHLRSSMGESGNGENKGLHENAMDCGMDATDAYAEVILNGLSALPLLCLSAFNKDYSSLSIAIINLLCRNYLAPPTWLPIVSRHFSFPDIIGRLLIGSPRQFDDSVLGFFLSMTQMEEGARLLQDVQIIKKLSKFVQAMERKQWLTPESIEGPFSGIRPEAEREGEWQLTISIVASVLDTLEGKEESVGVVEHALDFVGTHSDLLLSAFHVVPAATISKGREALGSASSRGGHGASAGFEPWVCTSMASLGRTERVVLLLCGMARHTARWTHLLPGSQDAFKQGCMRVLAYIAREGAGRLGKGAGAGAPGLSCTPNSREERMATKRDGLVGSKKGWFFICEVGATRVSASSASRARALKAPVPTPIPSVKRGETLSMSRTHSFNGPSSTAIVIRNSTTGEMGTDKVGNRKEDSARPSQYSDDLAIHVYRLALLILKFLCMLAQEPLSTMEERGHYDYSQFPELPSPEVLHALQDQCMAILLEIGERESGDIGNPCLQRVCLMLAAIIERTLYLEACAVKAYGIVPSPMRTHSFEKYYSQLRPLLQANRFLDATLTSLRSVVPIVHTGVM
ncbi:hypothetical protein CBR_g5647 [Chara braunii]|uniref:Nucleoporin Nup188 N-terminal subdomain III domain-containing protein n=1 Tax=Chara braunii TaxID=69332 RepID=A0A388JRS3_CHABU|nr:hypothetical protein CBR_g5647 [Chara braunii]|eukprot:GBG60473.1 hypothetical protein CBR_g5647 [Chara braunii]